MKKPFCNECGKPAEGTEVPIVGLRNQYGGIAHVVTIVLQYCSGAPNEGQLDLCQSCVTAACQDLARAAFEIEYPPEIPDQEVIPTPTPASRQE